MSEGNRQRLSIGPYARLFLGILLVANIVTSNATEQHTRDTGLPMAVQEPEPLPVQHVSSLIIATLDTSGDAVSFTGQHAQLAQASEKRERQRALQRTGSFQRGEGSFQRGERMGGRMMSKRAKRTSSPITPTPPMSPPTSAPVDQPTSAPSISSAPSPGPSNAPSAFPSASPAPSQTPSTKPSAFPSVSPAPSALPSASPAPSSAPTSKSKKGMGGPKSTKSPTSPMRPMRPKRPKSAKRTTDLVGTDSERFDGNGGPEDIFRGDGEITGTVGTDSERSGVLVDQFRGDGELRAKFGSQYSLVEPPLAAEARIQEPEP